MLKIDMIQIGDQLPVREFTPDNIQLFLYDAALWNAHRIHYDYQYATEIEGYPGLVVPGPLMGDWLTQCAIEWAGDAGELVHANYSNRQYACVGEVLRSQGTVMSLSREKREVTLDINIVNAADDILAPGQFVIRFNKI
ncbi:MAG: hypothetical protein K9G26_04865 [Emcibacter sp.]|nr:hypothetical protein [Emcibacter sp.]